MEDPSCKTPHWRLLKAQLNNLSPQNFIQQWEKNLEEAVLIDVRTKEEFKAGHIEGAKHISYLADDFWDTIESLPSDGYYFVYCRSGRRSIRACTLMRNGGFDNNRIFNLEGGYTAWVSIFQTPNV